VSRDPLADRLGEELHSRARELPYSRTDLAGAAVTRGRRIRTRRRVVAELGARSVRTTAPPAASRQPSPSASPSASPSVSSSPSPRASATSSPTPSSTPSTLRPSPRTPAVIALAAADLPLGAAPAVPYVANGRLVDAATSIALHLPSGIADVTAVARLGGSWVVAADVRASDGSTGPGAAVVVAPDGSVTSAVDGSRTVSGIAGAPDGSAVVVVDDGANGGRSTLTLLRDGQAAVSSSVDGRWLPVGFLDGTRVVLRNEDETASPAGRVWDVGTRRFLTSLSGRPTGAGGGLLGMWNGKRTDSGQVVCSDLLSAEAGSTSRLASSCSWQPQAFSVDGQRVLGSPAYGDGAGPTSLAVLGRSLRPVTTFTGEFEDGAYAFEPDGSVLVVASGKARNRASYAVVRCTVDGRCERASQVFPASDANLVPVVLGR